MKLVRIDPVARLYVHREGAGTSCYGFDVLDRKARAVGAWLDRQKAWHLDCQAKGSIGPSAIVLDYAADARVRLLDWPALGTESHFARCDSMLDLARRYCEAAHERCPVDLCPALGRLLGRRVEATYFGERIRFQVGISTGWMPVHLRLHNARSRGGEGLIAEHVTDVRVIR